MALKAFCHRFVDTSVVVFYRSIKSLLPETFSPLSLLFVILQYYHPTCSMWARVSRDQVLFCRLRDPGGVWLVSKVTIQQQHHQHFAKLYTPKGRIELSGRVCCSHLQHLTQTICACQLPVLPSSHTGMILKPFSGSMRN